MQETMVDLGHEYNDLTERQRHFVGMAARHADDFATRAAEHDRDASFPFENFAAMHESGYARICLPEEFGGQDADMEEYCLAQERLAHGCASTALCYNMHGFSTGLWAEFWRQGETMFEMPMRGVQGGMTTGGSASEAESANPFLHPACRVERVEGGYKLNGRKVFGSNTPINPMVFFNGMLEENGERKIMTFVIPKETPGVRVVEDWDTLGMRGTGSYSIEFKDCVAPEMSKMNEDSPDGAIADSPFASKFLVWFDVSIAAVYTGIGASGRNYAREFVSKRSRIPYGEVKHTPAVQFGLAEMYITVEASRGFYRRSVQRLKNPAWRDDQALALSVATKEFCTEAAQRVLDGAMQLVGGGAFFKRSPLERMYRDVRAGGFHPPNRYEALERVGKAELGISESQSPRFV